MENLFLYLAGFLVSYLYLKFRVRAKLTKDAGKYTNWNDWYFIFMTFAISIFSWAAVFISVIAIEIIVPSIILFNKRKQEPPKWL